MQYNGRRDEYKKGDWVNQISVTVKYNIDYKHGT